LVDLEDVEKRHLDSQLRHFWPSLMWRLDRVVASLPMETDLAIEEWLVQN
jgi:hypothetical protein